jgi:hypothetical protein
LRIERKLISDLGREVLHSYGYSKSNWQNVPSMVTCEIYADRYYQARRREKQGSQAGYVTALFCQDKKE